MLTMAQAGAEEGTWLRADLQTEGRGRQGRDWISPLGNFYASTVVRLRASDPPAPTLALVAVVALEEVVRLLLPASRRASLSVKWPNDLLLSGAKLSGILLERTDDAVVVGTGVNLAHHPAIDDRATTSLADHSIILAPHAFAERLAEMFAAWLFLWRRDGLTPIVARWMERAHPPGTPMIARLPGGESVAGAFDRLDGDGTLILRLAGGATRAIHAADIFLV